MRTYDRVELRYGRRYGCLADSLGREIGVETGQSKASALRVNKSSDERSLSAAQRRWSPS